jgi:hypothetical protein
MIRESSGYLKALRQRLGLTCNSFQLEDALPLDLVASMLRLGRKYEIFTAKNNAGSRIHYEFPSESDSWNNVEMTSTKIHWQPGSGFFVDVLKLAYEAGIYSSIPVIAFCCLREYKLVSFRT